MLVGENRLGENRGSPCCPSGFVYRWVSFCLKNRSQDGALFFSHFLSYFDHLGCFLLGVILSQKSLPGRRLIFICHFLTHFDHLGRRHLDPKIAPKVSPYSFGPFLTHFAHPGEFSWSIIFTRIWLAGSRFVLFGHFLTHFGHLGRDHFSLNIALRVAPNFLWSIFEPSWPPRSVSTQPKSHAHDRALPGVCRFWSYIFSGIDFSII